MDGGVADRELLIRARAGDLAAFAQLLERHRVPAARVAALLAGADAAADVLQDAFVRAHRALDTFDEERPVRAWLLAIVANQARNHRRSQWRRADLRLRMAGRRADDAASPEDAVLGAERRRIVLDAVNRLPEKDRVVIVCRYLLELTEAETVAVTGWPAGTVKSRLSRALGRLHAGLSGGMAMLEVGDA